MQWQSIGTANTEIGPSAKTKDGIFVEASATRFSAEASARKTTWQLHPTGNANAGYYGAGGAVRYGDLQRPSEGPGSGDWEGHKTMTGHTIRPSSRGGPIGAGAGGESPIQRAQAQSRQHRGGPPSPSASAAPLTDDDAYDRQLEMQGQVGHSPSHSIRRYSLWLTKHRTIVEQSKLCRSTPGGMTTHKCFCMREAS